MKNLINGTVSDTVHALIQNMKSVINTNSSILKDDPSRYDLRSESFDLRIWIDQMEYHLSKQKSNGSYPKYDLSCLRNIASRFVPKYLPECA